jgi:hypothetical protein
MITGADQHGQRVSHAFGLAGRFDVSMPFTQRVAAVIGARYTAVPNVHAQFYGPGAVTVGRRLQ